jgi:NACalpha-BTF3-like transcription factor
MYLTLSRTYGLLPLYLLLAVACAACNRPRKVDPKPPAEAADGVTQKTGSEAAGPGPSKGDIVVRMDQAAASPADAINDLSPSASTDGLPVALEADKADPDALMEKLKQLKFRARREVVATRTTIDNIPSYERALEKFAREFEQWGVATRIPTTPQLEELKGAITELTDRLGTPLLYYNVVAPEGPVRELPEFIYGDKSFTFEDTDVHLAYQVTIKVGTVPREKLVELIGALKELPRLLRILRVKTQREGTLINMVAFQFPEERYPLHRAEPRDLERRMQAMGIMESVEQVMAIDQVGYLQNAALSYKEINASLPKLNQALALLSRSKFLEARSDFFRRTVEAASQPTSIP